MLGLQNIYPKNENENLLRNIKNYVSNYLISIH